MIARRTSHAWVAATALLSAVFSGCATSPPTHYYTLARPAVSAPRTDGHGPTVLVASVSVPESVARAQMVVRASGSLIEISDQHRWAEPVRTGFASALADDLGAALEGSRASANPLAILAPDWRISVDVVRFDATLGSEAVVEALWIVRSATGEPRAGRSVVREATHGGNYEAVADAFSRAVAHVAAEIAQLIRQR